MTICRRLVLLLDKKYCNSKGSQEKWVSLELLVYFIHYHLHSEINIGDENEKKWCSFHHMPEKQLSMKSPRFVKFYKARGRKRNHHGNNNVVFELSIYNLYINLMN